MKWHNNAAIQHRSLPTRCAALRRARLRGAYHKHAGCKTAAACLQRRRWQRWATAPAGDAAAAALLAGDRLQRGFACHGKTQKTLTEELPACTLRLRLRRSYPYAVACTRVIHEVPVTTRPTSDRLLA